MKSFKHLFAVCLLLLVATTAMAQTQSDNTQTKAVSATKADVNGDGVVNEADIEEILAIMQQENGTKYYWYAGWTEPTAENIAEIIDEANAIYANKVDFFGDTPAGKLIGTQLQTYTLEQPLAKVDYYDTTYSIYDKHYIVIPEGIKVYELAGDVMLEELYDSTDIIIPGHRVIISKEPGFVISVMLR